MSTKDHDPSDHPELIIGIAGPIGVDPELIAQVIEQQLRAFSYDSKLIKLTTEMEHYPIDDTTSKAELAKYHGPDTFNTYMFKMSYANALRRNYDPAVLARIAIEAIRAERKNKMGAEDKARPRFAYIVRQLKRPEEG